MAAGNFREYESDEKVGIRVLDSSPVTFISRAVVASCSRSCSSGRRLAVLLLLLLLIGSAVIRLSSALRRQ